jgi:threonine dehydratase
MDRLKASTEEKIKNEAIEAEARIRDHIRETPLEYSPYLSQWGEGRVFLKLENLQLTGSFKLRGAANKILSLEEEQKRRGVVTASSGNHGVAVASLLHQFGMKGMIYLPDYVTSSKIEILRSYGVEVHFYGMDCLQTETFAREEAEKKGLTYIPPYNDIKIIGGQATVGMEMIRQQGKFDIVIVPVGGGGLISGIAGYLKSYDPNIEIVGCQPENSRVMFESVKTGKIVEMESRSTLSDGTAGGIEKDSLTFEVCRRYVDDFVLISEDEIKEAILLCLEKQALLIEGAAALPIAAFIKEKERFNKKNVVLVISGARISLSQLREVLCKGEGKNDKNF